MNNRSDWMPSMHERYWFLVKQGRLKDSIQTREGFECGWHHALVVMDHGVSALQSCAAIGSTKDTYAPSDALKRFPLDPRPRKP